VTLRKTFIYGSSSLTDAETAALKGTLLDEHAFDDLIRGEDCDVYKPDGTPLLLFRHRAIGLQVYQRAYCPLFDAAKPSTNRGDAAGGRFRPTKQDGTLATTTESMPVLSGIVGAYAYGPHCRVTRYTADRPRAMARILPFVRAVGDVFRREAPDQYAAQLAEAQQTHPYWVLPRTPFTTVTVNRNWATAVHVDKGDFRPGMGVISVHDAGNYSGCYLVFPKWRIAVDIRARDVLLCDVHEYHGNTPLLGIEGQYNRISTVMYYYTKMRRCAPPPT
jgi:hypothetical protein